MSRSFHILVALFVAMASASANAQVASRRLSDEQLIKRMSLREKIGQMFLVGFSGTRIEDGLDATISALGPGGIIVFGRNLQSARQTSELLLNAQRLALRRNGVPLLIGTDQEGGDVIRIKTAMPLPSALAIGRTDREPLAESAGFAAGQLLKTLGFNMNFAPVLDVADSDRPMFIGTRTFGSDPQRVARMGASFANGLVRAGVMPTGKHFPGHGGVEEDSHQGMPEKTATAQELRDADLVPFAHMKSMLGNRWAIMLAHIAYPELDSSRMPATFSKPIVTDLLRQELGFNGVVMTDDISMAGAKQIRDVRERVVRTVEAGSDLIMVVWNLRLQKELVLALEKAVRSGRISEARINESVRRILAAKQLFAVPNASPPTAKSLRLVVQNPKFAEIGEEIVRLRFARQPEPDELEFREFAQGKPVYVFAANARFAKTFKASLSGRNVRLFKLNVDKPYDVEKIMAANPNAVGVFYVSGYNAAKTAARISKDTARRMLVVTVETKGSLANADSFRYISEAYYRHPLLGQIVAEHYFKSITLGLQKPRYE